jgi:hypothetical protein
MAPQPGQVKFVLAGRPDVAAGGEDPRPAGASVPQLAQNRSSSSNKLWQTSHLLRMSVIVASLFVGYQSPGLRP